MISFQIKPWVAFGFPYLLIELFYIGMPVVRTDGRSVYGHVITKFSGMGRLPHFLSYGALPTRALRARWSSAIIPYWGCYYQGNIPLDLHNSSHPTQSHSITAIVLTLQLPKYCIEKKSGCKMMGDPEIQSPQSVTGF